MNEFFPDEPATTTPYTAIVLAADRAANDAVAAAGQVPCKCMAAVAGEPMIMRVLQALRQSRAVGQIIVVGPPDNLLSRCPPLHELIAAGTVSWAANRDSPSRSAAAVIAAVADDQPVLLTTADHALLESSIIDEFLDHANRTTTDVAVGLAPIEKVRAAFPGVRRTTLNFADGGFSSCNLFALKTARGREVVAFWRTVENQRKQPWRLLSAILGMTGALRYLVGKLTLVEAAERVTGRLGVAVMPVILAAPEAAVDVDTPEDLALAQAFLLRRQAGRDPAPGTVPVSG